MRVRNSGTAPARERPFLGRAAGRRHVSLGHRGRPPRQGRQQAGVGRGHAATGAETEFRDQVPTGHRRQRLQVRLNAAADDDVTATAETSVQVETVANLTMDVKEPSGPVAVGEEAVYEVRVRNRGTKRGSKRRGVRLLLPRHRADRRRGCSEVAWQRGRWCSSRSHRWPPGEEAVLKVHAKAEVAGNHVFRAESPLPAVSARLLSEATNLYYSDGPAAAQTARTLSATSVPAVESNGTTRCRSRSTATERPFCRGSR